jgi:glucokinase
VANERPDSALGRLAAERAPLGEDVLDLARKGDEVSVKVLQETGTWLGIGLATFVNIFDPEVIAIGGVSRRQEIWCWSLPAGSCGCGHTRLREIW